MLVLHEIFRMEGNTKENGQMENSMEKELIRLLTGHAGKVFGKKEKELDGLAKMVLIIDF